ncbi:MAG: YtxH domain-containing protein [Firmicutes bacterium]|nr:YtxH domain-containing protein [Bacillota bacterium]
MRRSNFTKGLITGTIIGATASMLFNPMEGRDKKMFRKKTGNLMRVVGNFIEDIADMRR